MPPFLLWAGSTRRLYFGFLFVVGANLMSPTGRGHEDRPYTPAADV